MGGVISLKSSQYRLVNGFSNSFWKWGGEDDDFYKRVMHYNLKVTRPDATIGRYTMMHHRKAEPNSKRLK